MSRPREGNLPRPQPLLTAVKPDSSLEFLAIERRIDIGGIPEEALATVSSAGVRPMAKLRRLIRPITSVLRACKSCLSTGAWFNWLVAETR